MVIMEEDEMEMSKEEFRRWIRDQLEKTEMLSPGTLEKYNYLLTLLERREKQTSNLLKLCQSVAKCEKTVKELYSLLGWEYSDSDSDDGDEPTGCGRTQPLQYGHSRCRTRCFPASNRPAPQWSMTKDKDNWERDGIGGNTHTHTLKRKAVVVLNRLSISQINKVLRPPTTRSESSEDESLNSAGSDMQWEPENDSSDSDFFPLEFNMRSNKRRKIHSTNKLEKICPTAHGSKNLATTNSGAKTPTASTQSNVKDNVTKKSADQESPPADSETSRTTATTPESNTRKSATFKSNTRKSIKFKSNTTKSATRQANTTKSATRQANTTKSSTPQANTTKSSTPQANTTKSSTPQANMKASVQSPAVKVSEPSADVKGVKPVGCQSSAATKTPPSVPQIQLTVNMSILARRRPLSWQLGKITEIITKEDGRIKYKVIFEEKGRILVSGHHIAFQNMPKLNQLFVGARVVIEHQAENSQYMPGVLAELPCRKNRMRFLVFVDDHRPVYVGLPLLHLVCRPLPDPLDDIPRDEHKHFMKEYLKHWPYPPLTQYRTGHTINVEYDGTLQKCEVITIDSSLMEVIFKSDQHKEWLYRGSMRLEHHLLLKQGLKRDETKTNKPPSVNESSKSKH